MRRPPALWPNASLPAICLRGCLDAGTSRSGLWLRDIRLLLLWRPLRCAGGASFQSSLPGWLGCGGLQGSPPEHALPLDCNCTLQCAVDVVLWQDCWSRSALCPADHQGCKRKPHLEVQAARLVAFGSSVAAPCSSARPWLQQVPQLSSCLKGAGNA